MTGIARPITAITTHRTGIRSITDGTGRITIPITAGLRGVMVDITEDTTVRTTVGITLVHG